MLADVRDKLVKSVDISLNINNITDDLIDSIESHTVKDNGKILKFQVYDPESNVNVNLFSRNRQVMLSDDFINYLKDNPEFEFRFA
jgi:DNA polymerase-3 subunit alpha